MPGARTLAENEAAIVREGVRILVAVEEDAGGRGAQTRVGKALGVSQQHVSRIIAQGSIEPIGWRIARSVARIAKRSERVTESMKQALDRVVGGLPEEEQVVRDDRYPNRARAIAAARSLGIDESAIAQVASVVLKSAVDPSPDDWFEMIRADARRLRFEAVAPVQVAAEKTAAEKRFEELRAQHEARPSIEELARKALEEHPPEEPPPRKTGLQPPAPKKPEPPKTPDTKRPKK